MARVSYADSVLNVPPGKNDVPYLTKLEAVRAVLKHATECFQGVTTGTGSAIEVTVPFDPAVVIAFKTAGTGAPVAAIKLAGMAADDTIKIVATGAMTYDTSGLITLTSGKFVIGTDADLNEASNAIRWVAFGHRDISGSV